jgi:hypothetical protein
MASLLDIAPSLATVTIQATAIPVPGVSVAGLADLIRRFEPIRGMLSGENVTLSVETLCDLGPSVVAAIIAAGTGQPGSAEHEAAAARLPLMDQAELIAKIIDVTFPAGLGKATALLEKLAGQVGPLSTDSPSPVNN